MDNATGFDLPEDCAETIFDICNEALSNIARHSGASRVASEIAGTRNAGTTVTEGRPSIRSGLPCDPSYFFGFFSSFLPNRPSTQAPTLAPAEVPIPGPRMTVPTAAPAMVPPVG